MTEIERHYVKVVVVWVVVLLALYCLQEAFTP